MDNGEDFCSYLAMIVEGRKKAQDAVSNIQL